MADIKRIQDRVDIITNGPRGGQAPAGVRRPAVPAVAKAATLGAPAPVRRPFSEFVSEDVDRAAAIAANLILIANAKGGEEGLADAVAEVERLRDTGAEQPAMVQHALKLFLTHHPGARKALRWKALEKRQPGLVLPSSAAPLAPAAPRAPADATAAPVPRHAGATEPENKLEFWREDPLVNEHHEHWHLVYPASPVDRTVRPPGKYPLGSRHGELFAYMHEQMLARYDAERLAVGVARVTQFDRYVAPIPQGYDPGSLSFWDGGAWTSFRARPAGATLSDLTVDGFDKRPGALLASQATFRDRMFAAGENGFYVVKGEKIPVTIETQGNTEEANWNSVDFRSPTDSFQTYGNHHNDGHIHFMLFDNTNPIGVMGTTATAVRDPVFFRWHKQVDAIYQSVQQNLPPYDFADGPPVRIRKTTHADGAESPDIILCRQYEFPTEIQFDDDDVVVPVDGDATGEALFGYSADPTKNRWDTDFSSATATATAVLGAGAPAAKAVTVTTTGELRTEMRERALVVSTGKTDNDQPILRQEVIRYLSHEDFYYFLRLENLSAVPQAVTVRIFLAPESEVEDRTMWIEMDRFLAQLAPSQKAVIYRPADLSSVVRQPALKWSDLASTDEPSPDREAQGWCDCGWPYTLLLPRGTAEGMPFRLFVMLSPGSDLKMPAKVQKCSSMSYCGLQDAEYPDSRAMGYPFDRPLAQSIAATVTARDNMAWRTIRIRWTNPLRT